MNHPMESSFERLLAKLVHDGIDFVTVGVSIPYLGPLGLIRLKLDTHREKDAVDVSALRQLLEDPDAFA